MVSAGTFSDPLKVIACLLAPPLGSAVTVGTQLILFGPAPFNCVIGGIQAYAYVAGTGIGSTVIDILKNGTSIWTTAANRPTLASASTGAFALSKPTTLSVRRNDLLQAEIVTIPASSGHGFVTLTLTLERP